MPKLHMKGLADYEIRDRFKEETLYDKVNKLINWKRIEKIIKSKYKKNKDALGNPAYPVIKMFKIILAQKWENLSDPQMEFALRDIHDKYSSREDGVFPHSSKAISSAIF